MTPTTMRAALDDGTGAYTTQDVSMPPIFPGAAVIRVRQTGICGSDLHMTNRRTEAQDLPSGHEVAGEIVELPDAGHGNGSGNGNGRGLRVGDRVAIDTVCAGRACLACRFCRYGQYRHCLSFADDSGGGFAQYMTRRPAGLFRLPDSLDWTDGALVEPMAVSVHALRYARMQPADVVAVVGSAPIGLSSIAAANAFGASKVIASAKYPQQAQMAEKMGADVVVGAEPGELTARVHELTDGVGADVVVESVGGEQTVSFTEAVRATRNQGTMVYLGGIKVPMAVDLFDPMLREVKIISSNCYGIIDGVHDYEVAIDLLASRRYPYRDAVTHRYPLEDIGDAFATAYDKGTGAVKVHVVQEG